MLQPAGNARFRWWRSWRKFVLACDSLEPGHKRNASRSRGWGAPVCRSRYADRDCRRFVLIAASGCPSTLIRRFPNRGIRMSVDQVVFDVQTTRDRVARLRTVLKLLPPRIYNLIVDVTTA